MKLGLSNREQIPTFFVASNLKINQKILAIARYETTIEKQETKDESIEKHEYDTEVLSLFSS